MPGTAGEGDTWTVEVVEPQAGAFIADAAPAGESPVTDMPAAEQGAPGGSDVASPGVPAVGPRLAESAARVEVVWVRLPAGAGAGPLPASSTSTSAASSASTPSAPTVRSASTPSATTGRTSTATTTTLTATTTTLTATTTTLTATTTTLTAATTTTATTTTTNGTATSSGTPSPGTRARTTGDSAAEQELTADLAAARLAAGQPAAANSGALSELARTWAGQLAMAGRLSHDAAFAKRIMSALSCRLVAENVGVGPETSSIHAALMGSAGHRANILEPGLKAVGVGAVRDQRGMLWVAQEFCAS